MVSNPPYVSEMEWDSLPREIREFEPAEALLAGPDGLSMIRPLVADAGEFLEAGDWLEIGETQGTPSGGFPAERCGSQESEGISARRDRLACWIFPADGKREGI